MEEMERIRKYTGTPEPRDVSPSSSQVVAVVSSNNSFPGQSSTRRDRHDDQISKKKNSRKTFFVARIKVGYELPAVVYRCIEYLDANDADKEEGIYRLSGAAIMLKHLKDRFNTEGDVDLLHQGEHYDIHAVAGLLKLYLRELPTSVLTRELRMEFVNVVDLLDRRDRINELGRLVSALPLFNYTLLRALTDHLIRIVQNSKINKMTVSSVSAEEFVASLPPNSSNFSLPSPQTQVGLDKWWVQFLKSSRKESLRTCDLDKESPIRSPINRNNGREWSRSRISPQQYEKRSKSPRHIRSQTTGLVYS
ncbi:Rho GTPase activation protein [Gigaspora rosea]|uniref:Rho GTPase activation protein n=1 Tax=Gigaspora rosea TaxID=44941 RepID=A0A397UYK1_9GLOM|nr:Rho GTPase activation protein [Gigaspora rosea]